LSNNSLQTFFPINDRIFGSLKTQFSRYTVRHFSPESPNIMATLFPAPVSSLRAPAQKAIPGSLVARVFIKEYSEQCIILISKAGRGLKPCMSWRTCKECAGRSA